MSQGSWQIFTGPLVTLESHTGNRAALRRNDDLTYVKLCIIAGSLFLLVFGWWEETGGENSHKCYENMQTHSANLAKSNQVKFSNFLPGLEFQRIIHDNAAMVVIMFAMPAMIMSVFP